MARETVRHAGMYIRKIITAASILLILYCIREYNPFNDPSNAGIIITSHPFTDSDSIAIFSAETLSVDLTLKELL